MTTAQYFLFAAVVTQVALTIVIYVGLVRARFAYASVPENRRPELAYDQAAWPVKARQLANSVASQFELPVLFYVGVLFAYQFGSAGWLAAILAWGFVATRIIHALIHTGKNVVIQRFQVFITGFVILIAFWIVLALNVFGVI